MFTMLLQQSFTYKSFATGAWLTFDIKNHSKWGEHIWKCCCLWLTSACPTSPLCPVLKLDHMLPRKFFGCCSSTLLYTASKKSTFQVAKVDAALYHFFLCWMLLFTTLYPPIKSAICALQLCTDLSSNNVLLTQTASYICKYSHNRSFKPKQNFQYLNYKKDNLKKISTNTLISFSNFGPKTLKSCKSSQIISFFAIICFKRKKLTPNEPNS